jgi:hypothetical protein
MSTTVIRVRFDPATMVQLYALAESWQQTVSGVVRNALNDLIQHPERHPTVLAAHLIAVEDTRSPAQVAAWEQDRQALEAFDLGEVLAAQGVQGAECEALLHAWETPANAVRTPFPGL